MPTPLDFSKPVQTRDGQLVRILCTDRKGTGYPVVGLVMKSDCCEMVSSWTTRGFNSLTQDSCPMDLVQAPQPRKHAELIKKWADDDSVRVKRMSPSGWIEDHCPGFYTVVQYEEILPGDPLY